MIALAAFLECHYITTLIVGQPARRNPHDLEGDIRRAY